MKRIQNAMKCISSSVNDSDMETVKMLVKNGANDYDRYALLTVTGGRLDLLKFFMEKGIKNTLEVYNRAFVLQRTDMVDYLESINQFHLM